MGFCTDVEYKEFIESVSKFEHMLVYSGIKLFKYYLDISKPEQKRRLDKRKLDLLTQWKISALDNQALRKWKQFSLARDEMLAQTHNLITPWTIVHADDKQLARLNIIKDILSRLDYVDKAERLVLPDLQIVSTYDAIYPEKNLLAR